MKQNLSYNFLFPGYKAGYYWNGPYSIVPNGRLTGNLLFLLLARFGTGLFLYPL